MFGFIAKYISKDIARHERKKITKLKAKFEKETRETIKLNEEIAANQKEHQKQLFLKDIEERNKNWEEKLQRKEEDFKKQLKERDDEIQKLKDEKEQLKQKHENDIKKIQKNFEEQDEARIKEIFLLKDEVQLEYEKGRNYRIIWEERAQFVKNLLFEIMSRIDNNQFLSEEIIKRVNSMISSKTEFEDILKRTLKHIEKTNKDSIFFSEEKHLLVPERKIYEIPTI